MFDKRIDIYSDGTIEYDPLLNGIDYLEKSLHFLKYFPEKDIRKWFTICLTDALYSLMIGALEGFDCESSYDFEGCDKESEKRIRNLKERCVVDELTEHLIRSNRRDQMIRNGKAKIVRFSEALDRIQDPEYMHHWVFSQTPKLTDDEKNTILSLRRGVRDSFIHFEPHTLITGFQGVLEKYKPIFKLNRFLLLESHNMDITGLNKLAIVKGKMLNNEIEATINAKIRKIKIIYFKQKKSAAIKKLLRTRTF